MITSEKLSLSIIILGIVLNIFIFGTIVSGPEKNLSNLPEIARISGCRG